MCTKHHLVYPVTPLSSILKCTHSLTQITTTWSTLQYSHAVIVYPREYKLMLNTNYIHLCGCPSSVSNSISNRTRVLSSIIWPQIGTADSLWGSTHKAATPTGRAPLVANRANGPNSITPQWHWGSRSVVWWCEGHSSRWTVLDGDGHSEIYKTKKKRFHA